MSSIDFFAIKEKIRDILKNDTTNIFASSPSDKSKFRRITAGAPNEFTKPEGPYPRMWITNDNLMATVRNLATVGSNAQQGRQYDIRIKIIMAVESKSSESSEEDIDDFTKVVIEKLETDYDLRTIGGAESTRVADWSYVSEIRDLDPRFKADGIRGRTLIFHVFASA